MFEHDVPADLMTGFYQSIYWALWLCYVEFDLPDSGRIGVAFGLIWGVYLQAYIGVRLFTSYVNYRIRKCSQNST